MRSLREHEFWKAISSRLENYTEETNPDDWDNIAGAIPSRSTDIMGFSRSVDIVTCVIVIFLIGFQMGRTTATVTPSIDSESTVMKIPNHEREPSDAGIKILDHHSANDSRNTDRNNISSVKAESDQTPRSFTGDKMEFERDQNRGKHTYGNDSYASAAETTPIVHSSLVLTDSRTIIEKEENSILNPAKVSEIKKQADSIQVSAIGKTDSVGLVNVVSEQKKKKQRKFHPSVFFQFAPSLAFEKIIPLVNDNITIQKLNSSGIISSDRFGLGGDIGFQIPLNRSFEVYAGLSYYRQRQVISYDYFTDEQASVIATNKPLSFDVTPSTATRQFSYDMSNQGISVGTFYFLRGRQLLHKIGGGLFYMKGFQQRRQNDSYQNARSQYVGYQLQYRLEYLLNTRIGVYTQPFFNHAVFSSEKLNEPFKIKPSRAGIIIGLTYHF